MTTTSNVIPFDRRQLRRGECLYCYLTRILETRGCDHTLTLTRRWIEAQPRSARWVVKWAHAQGGYCDCDVTFNVFRDDKRSARHRKVRCAPSYDAQSVTEPCRGAEG
jgi:hypothetical protein